jgi:hypothetical protein
MYHTLFDFLTHTEGTTYIVIGVLLISFIPFWKFLTERERKE